MTLTTIERVDTTEVPPAKTPKQILLDAADILEQEGKWTQGDWFEACDTNPDGVSYCADGALTVAAGITRVELTDDGDIIQHHLGRYDSDDVEAVYQAYETAYTLASAYVRERGTHGGIIHYNDANGRTQTEVVGALRAAAQLA